MCLILKHINPEKGYKKYVVNILWGRCCAKLFILFSQIRFVLKAAAEGFYYFLSRSPVMYARRTKKYLQYYKYVLTKKKKYKLDSGVEI